MTVTDLSSFTAEVFDRVVAMEKLVVPTAQAGKYASFTYAYGNLYWTNWLESIVSPQQIVGVDEFLFTLPIRMRLHTGYTTQGFDGDMEAKIQTVYVPAVMTYFWARRDLTYTGMTTRIPFFEDDAFDFSCVSGLGIYEGDGPNQKMLGADFRLTVKARMPIRRSI